MKVGKYPVKHSYKISRLVSDVFSLGLAVLIVSVTVNFFRQYNALLTQMRIGQDNVENIVQNFDSSIVWRQWLALIFPALVLAVFAAYLILTLKSHKFTRWRVTKLTAQECYDTYAFCVSLCKIPALLAVFDVMYIVHNRMLFIDVSPFSLQVLLDAVMIAIIVRFTMHRLDSITARPEKKESSAVKLRAVAADENDNKPKEE